MNSSSIILPTSSLMKPFPDTPSSIILPTSSLMKPFSDTPKISIGAYTRMQDAWEKSGSVSPSATFAQTTSKEPKFLGREVLFSDSSDDGSNREQKYAEDEEDLPEMGHSSSGSSTGSSSSSSSSSPCSAMSRSSGGADAVTVNTISLDFRDTQPSSRSPTPPRSRSSRSKRKPTSPIDAGMCFVTDNRGSKDMAELGLSTACVELVKRKFLIRLNHYVILTHTTEPAIRIPAILMSNRRPSRENGHTTREAEVLPLGFLDGADRTTKPGIPFTKANFRMLFQKGTKFHIKVVAFGRRLEPRAEFSLDERKKNVINDLADMPWKQICEEKTTAVDNNAANVDKKLNEQAKGESLSHFVPSLRLRGLEACGGNRDFAAWFARLPAHIKVDKNFQCDVGVLKKDNFQRDDQLFEYLGISDAV